MSETTVDLPALPGPGESCVPPWPGEDVRLGEQVLFVRRAGAAAGPAGADGTGTAEMMRAPVVLVHGLGGASTNWTDLMFLLSGQFDCWAPDLPGFGRSGPPRGGRHPDYGLDTHVGAVVRLIEHIGRGAVHLVGNSMGGAIATRLAAERPGLVRTLTLVSPALPAVRPRRNVDPRLALLLLPGLSRVATSWIGRQSADARTRAMIRLCFANPGRVPEERYAEAVQEMRERRGMSWSSDALVQSLRGLVAGYAQRGRRNLWRQAAVVAAPTVLIWGRHDRLVHPDVGRRAVTTFPDARLVVLEDAGHVAMMELPERVAREFLGTAGAQ